MKKVLFTVCAASLMLCACEREATVPAPELNPASVPSMPGAAPAAPAPAVAAPAAPADAATSAPASK